MKKGLTELVFILDKSGSMGGMESDTIGGYNSLLEKQKAVEGEACITTVLFDNTYELLHDRIDIKGVSPITEKEYCVGGSTALLDAIGKTIHKIDNVQKNTAEDYRAEKVMVVIITDGEENSSREYAAENIKAQIKKKKEEYGWEFIFLGANIDAVAAAGRLGISPNRAQNYHQDGKGSRVVYETISKAQIAFRTAPVRAPLPDNWNADIEEDYQQRGGKSKSS
jgi:uncharacterized protein YegL